MSADNLHRIRALKLERLLLRQRIEQLDRQIAALKSQPATPLCGGPDADADSEPPAYRVHFDSTRVIVAAVETGQSDRTSVARAFDPC